MRAHHNESTIGVEALLEVQGGQQEGRHGHLPPARDANDHLAHGVLGADDALDRVGQGVQPVQPAGE